MPQNKETGAAANQFGKESAKKIANLLGLKRLSNNSNEVLYDNKNAVIKSARRGNIYIGVTLKMLERIELILAAIENHNGNFELYQLDSDVFKDNIRIGHHKHIALVRNKIFIEEGKFIQMVKLNK